MSLDCIPDTSIYVSTANVMASPVDRLHTCPSRPHKFLRCPSRCRSQPPLDFYGPDLSVSGLTLWHDHPRILASWGATTNTRVVRLHTGRADLLLHHLTKGFLELFLLCHLVLARLLTADWLGHLVALLLVLDSVAHCWHLLQSGHCGLRHGNNFSHIWWLLSLNRLALPSALLDVLTHSLWHLAGPCVVHGLVKV